MGMVEIADDRAKLGPDRHPHRIAERRSGHGSRGGTGRGPGRAGQGNKGQRQGGKGESAVHAPSMARVAIGRKGREAQISPRRLRSASSPAALANRCPCQPQASTAAMFAGLSSTNSMAPGSWPKRCSASR